MRFILSTALCLLALAGEAYSSSCRQVIRQKVVAIKQNVVAVEAIPVATFAVQQYSTGYQPYQESEDIRSLKEELRLLREALQQLRIGNGPQALQERPHERLLIQRCAACHEQGKLKDNKFVMVNQGRLRDFSGDEKIRILARLNKGTAEKPQMPKQGKPLTDQEFSVVVDGLLE